MLNTRNSYHLSFNITYIARKLLLGYLNILAIVLLVYLSSVLLLVAIFTTKVVQLAVILGILTIVFIAKDIVRP